MSRLNHHMGVINDATNTRLLIVWKQNPQNPLMSLVIKIDSVTKTVDRDMLLEMVSSAAAQNEPDFFTILQKKNLLKYYHDSHIFTAMPIDQVIMTPGDGRRIPLREIVNAINTANGTPALPDPSFLENMSDANPLASKMKEESSGEKNKAGIAKSILTQAKLMQQETNKLLQKAFSMDYNLKNEWVKMFPGESTNNAVPTQQSTPEKQVVKKKIKKKMKKQKKQILLETPKETNVA